MKNRASSQKGQKDHQHVLLNLLQVQNFSQNEFQSNALWLPRHYLKMKKNLSHKKRNILIINVVISIVAYIQNICNLTGWEEYNIVCILLLALILYLEKKHSDSVSGKYRNLSIWNKLMINYWFENIFILYIIN